MALNRADSNPPGALPHGGFNFPDLNESDPAEEKDNGWLISFVDILTLLITLFVLLLSFSHFTQRDTPRRNDIAVQPPSSPVSHHAEVQPAPTPASKSTPVFSIPQDIQDKVDVVATTTAVNLVIKDDVLFDEGSAQLTPLGNTILDGIAGMLKQSTYPVSVEGHTDNVPIKTAQFPSNWELSSFRATNVARYFIQQGVAEGRLSAVGFADTRPIADNSSEAGRARNRRVSLVIHVNEPLDMSSDETEENATNPN